MPRAKACKCQHCKESYLPDARNRHHQRYCRKPECRKASKAHSQAKWLSKPQNRDYFGKGESTARVKAWRKAHPECRQRREGKRSSVQQDLLITQPIDRLNETKVKQERCSRVQQDLFAEQTPLMLGLISHLADTVQQEDIVAMAGRFISKGRAVLGLSPLRPSYDQTRPSSGATAAHPVAI